jgi:hypothetical protein
MKLKPLEQFICGTCGEIIQTPSEGYVLWLRNESDKSYGFKIVHHSVFSPRKQNGNEDCYTYSATNPTLSLSQFVGDQGIVQITSFLDTGPYHQENYKGPEVSDLREFTELIRRVQIPYYEEARFYWDEAQKDGFFDSMNQVLLYLPETLKKLIDKYAESSSR